MAKKGKKQSKEYDNTNTIRLFKNESDHEQAPAFSGLITVGKDLVKALQKGVTEDLEVAIWKRETEAGKKFYAGNIALPYAVRQELEEEGDDDDSEDDDEWGEDF